MKFFFHAFANSLYKFRWIASMKDEGKKAVGYYFFFVLLASLFLSIPLVHFFYQGIDSVERYVRSDLPAFTAEIKNGELAVTGMEQPYHKELAAGEPFWLIVDTVSTSTDVNIAERVGDRDGGAILFTKTAMTVYEIQGGVERTNKLSWSDFKTENVTFSKDTLLSWVDKLKGGVKLGITFGLLIFIYIFLLAGKALYLLFLTILAFLVVLIAKKKVSFGQMYIIGLFAITLPTLLDLVLQSFGVYIPFLYTILVLAVSLGVVFVKELPPVAGEQLPPQQQ